MEGPSNSFGYLDQPSGCCWSAGNIEPLSTHLEIVSEVRSNACHHDGWFYSPVIALSSATGEAKVSPFKPIPFSLPSTHQIGLSSEFTDDASVNFFIGFFGFLNGLRLQRETWQHLTRNPTKSGTLCDFTASKTEIRTALDIASNFWMEHPTGDTRKLAFASLHWHLLAQLYEHAFERFNAQYIAFDACWRLAVELNLVKMREVTHAEKPKKLAETLGIKTPEWAKPLSNKRAECLLSQQRNLLFHEAIYAGEPIGFASPAPNFHLTVELTGFVARCWLRLIGVSNEYTHSSVTTRQLIGFAF